MFQIKKFLHPNICKYIIDYINSNIDNSRLWNERKIIPVNENVDDPIIKNLHDLYVSLRPKEKLVNMELISWVKGGSHDWHDDTIYYKYTTITYLNENFTGGRTELKDLIIEPEVGKFIGFDASTLHKVNKLESGSRYVILAWYNYG